MASSVWKRPNQKEIPPSNIKFPILMSDKRGGKYRVVLSREDDAPAIHDILYRNGQAGAGFVATDVKPVREIRDIICGRVLGTRSVTILNEDGKIVGSCMPVPNEYTRSAYPLWSTTPLFVDPDLKSLGLMSPLQTLMRMVVLDMGHDGTVGDILSHNIPMLTGAQRGWGKVMGMFPYIIYLGEDKGWSHTYLSCYDYKHSTPAVTSN